MPTPLSNTHHEKLDLEIGWRLPLAKHLEDSLLGILILYRRTLRAFEPADYVFHVLLLFLRMSDRSQRFSLHRRRLVVPGEGTPRVHGVRRPSLRCGHRP